jgi:hypothetical protein
MKGTRIYPNAQGDLLFTEPGMYGKDKDGHWLARVPSPDFLMGRLDAHDIIEHEDDTITVSPSILVERHDGKTWHGYLERGVWREV